MKITTILYLKFSLLFSCISDARATDLDIWQPWSQEKAEELIKCINAGDLKHLKHLD